MTELADFNQQVIAEFRANGGKVGGRFERAPLVLLTTTGARSGRPRTNPAVYLRDGDRILVFASNAGGPVTDPPRSEDIRHRTSSRSEAIRRGDPAWYHDILADPKVVVELGEERFAARAVPLEGEERDRVYARQAAIEPAFAAYQEGTDRVIPVIALYPENERLLAFGNELVKIHDYFRAELARLRAGEASADDLRVHCLAFCDRLTFHHTGEDGVVFPHLERAFPELAEPLDRLRSEHVVIAALIGELRAGTEPATLERVAGELEAHFAYEEEQLVPVLNSLASVPWG
ncbi:nitroreductase/quinone reductase family protein [Nonomuraea sp. NPDC049480]|uniref:nitroreductase/quinone reductase family protein n=1 Tax=Nonomuraea sp. NPDC049480 TaxID=3364353 RepID=UPI0037B5C9F0